MTFKTQPRLPGTKPQRLPREVGAPRRLTPRGPFSHPQRPPMVPQNPLTPQFKEVPTTPWWETLLAAVTVETTVAAAFLGPMGIVADHYLDRKDEVEKHPLFTPCGSEPHLREREIFPERRLSDMERLRRNLRWYADDDHAKGKRLGRDIESLKILIADMERQDQLSEIQTRLNGLNPNSTEARLLRQSQQWVQSAMGTVPAASIGAQASSGIPAIPPPPSIPPPPLDEAELLEREANDLAVRLAVLRRYSNRSRREWDVLALQLEDESGGLRGKLLRIRTFVEGEENRIGETRLHQSPPSWVPDPIIVPPYLKARLMNAYGQPDGHVTIGDLSRAYNYYFGDMGGLPPSRSHRKQFGSTHEIVYGQDTVHRLLSTFLPLSDVEKQARDQVKVFAQQMSLHDFGGHWWALGAKVVKADRRTIPSTLRFYLPINPEFAPQVMAALVAIVSPYVRARHDVQFKMAQDPREWRGDDGALVYSGRQDYLRVGQELRALENQHPNWFRQPIGSPLVARILKSDGTLSAISVAQSPPDASTSVNGQLAEKMTRAMQWYRLQRARGLHPNVDTMIEFAARQIKSDGRDLERPGFLAMDQDSGLPGWVTYMDVFRHTDQYDEARDGGLPGVSPDGVERLEWPGPSKLYRPHKAGVTYLHRPRTNIKRRVREQRGDGMHLSVEVANAMRHPGIPDGEGPDNIPVGQLTMMGSTQMWRVSENVLFARNPSDPRTEHVVLYFEDGYSTSSTIVLLEQLRMIVKSHSALAVYEASDKRREHPLVLRPAYIRNAGRETVVIGVFGQDPETPLATIPWHSRWMKESILSTLLEVQR